MFQGLAPLIHSQKKSPKKTFHRPLIHFLNILCVQLIHYVFTPLHTFTSHLIRYILHQSIPNTTQSLIQKHFPHTLSKTLSTHSFKSIFPPPYSYRKLFVLSYPLFYAYVYPKYYTVFDVLVFCVLLTIIHNNIVLRYY